MNAGLMLFVSAYFFKRKVIFVQVTSNSFISEKEHKMHVYLLVQPEATFVTKRTRAASCATFNTRRARSSSFVAQEARVGSLRTEEPCLRPR